MAPSTISFLFLLLPLLNPASAADTLVDTCNQCAATNPNINSTLCVSLLSGSVPKNWTTPPSLSDLGALAVSVAIANATAAFSAAGKLLESPQESAAYGKACLEDCKGQFDDAVSRLEDSVRAMNAGRIKDARTWISAAAASSTTCEDCFAEKGDDFPLKKESADLAVTLRISLAIAALLDG
ncbi:hypothetical protein HPP92_021578 [Vanilla planifolia]|uniref:Pectinesterase inhibitor domain-containing protein n=1 Tax=Vanilla planifolia TaxID=51239 RepID=A0A835PZD6_VANPL|nr:hypothetical protein HPP92_021578 [Vanilla planifolia]